MAKIEAGFDRAAQQTICIACWLVGQELFLLRAREGPDLLAERDPKCALSRRWKKRANDQP
jgi:hypothetical protein